MFPSPLTSFEMPFNILCDGCNISIGMGVRYTAEKTKVGDYRTTPAYRFRMRCHMCVNYIEIQTDPASGEYTIVSGAQRNDQNPTGCKPQGGQNAGNQYYVPRSRLRNTFEQKPIHIRRKLQSNPASLKKASLNPDLPLEEELEIEKEVQEILEMQREYRRNQALERRINYWRNEMKHSNDFFKNFKDFKDRKNQAKADRKNKALALGVRWKRTEEENDREGGEETTDATRHKGDRH